eukprot:TRINITY_DN2321_c0_g1_i1.p1 TRINITY_DN2321_c0_g1~~TRINITY_DN2321_c0_g1_i1.p1  ORF type:complete len:360 (-),score=88.00 TRINITY_DN2321_c0_g1_i1:525-1523(-)
MEPHSEGIPLLFLDENANDDPASESDVVGIVQRIYIGHTCFHEQVGRICEATPIVLQKLEKLSKKKTIGKITGSALGIAGGVVSTVGAISAFFTFGATLPLLIVGAAIGGAGAAVGGGFSIADHLEEKKAVEELQRLQEEAQTVLVRLLKDVQLLAGMAANHAELATRIRWELEHGRPATWLMRFEHLFDRLRPVREALTSSGSLLSKSVSIGNNAAKAVRMARAVQVIDGVIDTTTASRSALQPVFRGMSLVGKVANVASIVLFVPLTAVDIYNIVSEAREIKDPGRRPKARAIRQQLERLQRWQAAATPFELFELITAEQLSEADRPASP